MSQDIRMVDEALLFFSEKKFQIVKLPKYDCNKRAALRCLQEVFAGVYRKHPAQYFWMNLWVEVIFWSTKWTLAGQDHAISFLRSGKPLVASAQHQAINCDPTTFHNNPNRLEEEEMKLSGKFFSGEGYKMILQVQNTRIPRKWTKQICDTVDVILHLQWGHWLERKTSLWPLSDFTTTQQTHDHRKITSG